MDSRITQPYSCQIPGGESSIADLRKNVIIGTAIKTFGSSRKEESDDETAEQKSTAY